MSTTLSLRPTIYYPSESNGGFIDDISGIFRVNLKKIFI